MMADRMQNLLTRNDPVLLRDSLNNLLSSLDNPTPEKDLLNPLLEVLGGKPKDVSELGRFVSALDELGKNRHMFKLFAPMWLDPITGNTDRQYRRDARRKK